MIILSIAQRRLHVDWSRGLYWDRINVDQEDEDQETVQQRFSFHLSFNFKL